MKVQSVPDRFVGGPLDGQTLDLPDSRDAFVDPDSGAGYIRWPEMDTGGERWWCLGGMGAHPRTVLSIRPAEGRKHLTLGELRTLVDTATAAGTPADAVVHATVSWTGKAQRLELKP